jgi:glutaredoxin-like YruB-family protein
MAVTVYSTPTCRFCTAAKRYLARNGVRFREVDVSRDAQAAAEVARRTGRNSVPVIDVNGRLIVGFDQRRLAAALGIRR